ncbi:MAG: DUF4249 domain-containing protein [Paludibacter sp.]|nr:DUF4249 domain-containing protein [Paludibacter sp.]
MQTFHKILILLLSTILLVACEKEIEFKGEISNPMIVVNSYVSPDSLVYAHLTKSKFFLSSKKGFDYVNNAEVSIYVNSQFKENLNFTADGMYRGSFKPMVGDTVKLLVKTAGFEDVESVTIIQSPSTILSVDTTMVIKYRDLVIEGKDTMACYYSGDVDFRIKINDNGNEQNYYRLVVKKRFEKSVGDEIIIQDYFISFILEGFEDQTGTLLNLFEDSGNSSDQHLITDELFNGKEFILKFKTDFDYLEIFPGYEDDYPYYESSDTTYVIINLQTISKDMYLYLKSKESAEGVFDGIFTEPVQIYNNITNGIGIFGSYTNNQIQYKLR